MPQIIISYTIPPKNQTNNKQFKPQDLHGGRRGRMELGVRRSRQNKSILQYADNVCRLLVRCSNQTFLIFMGCCLHPQKDDPPPKQKPRITITHPPDTERPSLPLNNTERQKQQSICGRTSNIDFESNSSVRQTKLQWKSGSTAIFSSQRSSSNNSILQMTIDHQSILKETDVPTKNQEDYYVMMENKAFIKKTGDSLKVNMPDGQSVLHCNQQHVFSVLSISEGKPVDCLEEIAPNRIIIKQSSPIKLKLRLKCQHCKKHMKISYCISLVNISTIVCSNCEKVGKWSLTDIISNFKIWGNGQKIDNHEKIEPAPSTIRIIGCVNCFKFSNLQSMKCECSLCTQCKNNQNISLDEECWMCQNRSYID